jgi:anti-sigma-K factor RskA
MKEELEEQMLDLLCKQAVYGLNEEETRQLAELEKSAGTGHIAESFEMTAAAISTVGLDTNEELPANLRSRILAEAERHFDAPEQRDLAHDAAQSESSSSLWNWLGWAVVAAACIALTVNIYTTRIDDQTARGGTPTPTPEEKLSPSQMRQRLIDTAPDLAKITLGAGTVKELEPSGDVVWSDAKQAGYVRVSGLPKNDAAKETYQLWIFEENQGDKTPIDGGTFNINSDGEVIIPINAHLKAKNPGMFAVTVEKPGGVVVSERGKIAALAKRET